MIDPNPPHPIPGRLIEVADTDLEFRSLSVPNETLTGRQILGYCDCHPFADFVVLQWLPNGDLEEIREDEAAVWSEGIAPRFIVSRSDRTFRIQLNDRVLEWPSGRIPEPILRKLGRVPAEDALYVRRDGADHPLQVGDAVDLADRGVEVVFSRARTWTLNVQGVTVHSSAPEITVRTAIERAGFDVMAAWIIVLKTAAERRQVDLDYKIDLRLPGIEKLRLTPREINNGEVQVGMVRQFALLPTDETGLAERGLSWETMMDTGRRWLILRDVALPAGFNVASVDVAVEIPPAYPNAELDMFYCHPFLARIDGREIPQTQIQQPIMGRIFQRWSRHRGAIAPWRPGRDSVLTHLALIDTSLTREVE